MQREGGVAQREAAVQQAEAAARRKDAQLPYISPTSPLHLPYISPISPSSAPPTSARSRLGRGFLALGSGKIGFGLLGSGVFGFGSRSPHSGAQVSISLILESFARKSSGLNRGQRRMLSTPGLDTGILKGLVGGPLGLD